MKAIQDTAALFFLVVVMVLTFISVLGIWDMLGDDVITKSFQTLCLIAFVTAVIVAGAKYFKHENDAAIVVVPNPIFKKIRIFMITVMVVSAALLAFLGVLAIWEVVPNMDVLYRSLGSLGVIAFSTFLATIICLDREGKPNVVQTKNLSAGSIIGLLFLFWLMWSLINMF